MKIKLALLLLFTCFLIVTFWGCYTQLETIRDENESYSTEQYNDDSEYDQDTTRGVYEVEKYTYDNYDYYCDDYSPRYRVGFSYYYPLYYWPSYAFSAAYADPWFYDYYWSYDPWSYRSYYYPHYRYGYYYPYYYPYYYSYYANVPSYTRRTDGSRRHNVNVDGVIRTVSEPTVDTRTNFDLSLPASYGGVSNTDRKLGNRENTRRTENIRYTRKFENFGSDSKKREDTRYIRRSRDYRQQQNSSEQNPQPSPPSHQLQPRDNQGSTPAYTQPPRQSTNQSPPKNDSRRSDGNNRGGNNQREKRP